MAIRQVTSSEEVKRPLGRFQLSKHQTQDYYDLHSAVELLDVKNIINNHKAYIELVDYGYLQLMEISGKDLGSLSYNEVNRTLDNFEKWITDFNTNVQIEVTTLPTDTTTQIADLRHHLSLVRQEKAKLSPTSRRYYQLEDQEQLLHNNMQVEESIQQEIYNTEFILWLFAPTTSEMDELVRKAKTYGNNDFVPQDISITKKEQIIKQYNNMNEKV
ncbi:hypothetical protein SGADD02_00720 [Streptococcus gallolyticus]|uniref:Uncharacterized protein n=1 Tax=Streptococcus gallolyticus TaxID=315405 RepID=A0A139N7J3_9STRE|nr:hypothetical protein [Streptococcus gallolyticus]KXT71787.1 hypothetical protein SGADD02_00720 [Streptococcus gallolyticus]